MGKSQRKPIFFTSDWHLGHKNSILFDNRPFRDITHMHKSLIKSYNACVPKHGICYFLGDVGLCNNEIMKPIFDKLNGTKVLVLGNHDKGINAMYNLGFDVVVYGITLYIANERVTLTHCPLRDIFREDVEGMKGAFEGDNWHGESKHYRFSIQDTGQFHLHGHIHSNDVNGKLKIDGRQFDVGVPANNYRPVSISQIERWIGRYKLNRGDNK